jgi:beta-glucosidase
LLKNSDNELPLPASHTSIAVIGADASLDPDTSGEGSSAVQAPWVITPLSGIHDAVGKSVKITYSSGAPNAVALGSLDNSGAVFLKPLPILVGDGLKSQLANDDLSIEAAANVTNTVNTASEPARGRGWSHWTAVFRARATGEYEVAVKQVGDTWFSMNGRRILASSGLHEPVTMTDMVKLKKGHRYTFKGTWFTVLRNGPPEFGISNVTSKIQAAVAAARAAKVAVVFASQPSTEGADQTTLSLPGDENQLIEAVAAANPHTVVVLNTEGAVLMPWLNQVQSVLEAWYPGEEDGTAISSVLFGSFDPAGRLPLTFPSSETTQPLTSVADFPGVNDVADFGTGSDALDIGYRWYQAHDVRPLFPFGFGLSYTTFSLAKPSIQETSSSLIVRLDVTNVGHREGIDVVQSYVKYPSTADEPPEQLKAFARVALAPLATRRIALTIPISNLSIFLHNSFNVLPGKYQVSVGQSSADLPISLQVKIP